MEVILGILNNPLVLAVLGLVVKFVPGVRTFLPNKLIPALLAVVAWLGQVAGPQVAHASGGPLYIAALPIFGLAGGFLGGLGSAVWQSAQAYLVNEMFLRHFTPKKPTDSL